MKIHSQKSISIPNKTSLREIKANKNFLISVAHEGQDNSSSILDENISARTPSVQKNKYPNSLDSNKYSNYLNSFVSPKGGGSIYTAMLDQSIPSKGSDGKMKNTPIRKL